MNGCGAQRQLCGRCPSTTGRWTQLMSPVRNAATASIGACTSVGPGGGRARRALPRFPIGAPAPGYAGGALLHKRQIGADRNSRLDAGSVVASRRRCRDGAGVLREQQSCLRGSAGPRPLAPEGGNVGSQETNEYLLKDGSPADESNADSPDTAVGQGAILLGGG